MATSILSRPPARPRAARHPQTGKHIAGWVLDKTDISPTVLWTWRDKGWLTPPSGPPAHPGTGHRFDWHAALEQIGWLARLHADRLLDQEDADAGWRLRANGCEWAVRHHPGPWIPADTLMAAKPLLTCGGVITVARVRAI